MKRLLLVLITLSLVLSGCKTQKEEVVEDGVCLRSFILTNGYKANGTLNGFELNDEVKVYLLNADKQSFEETELSDELLTGNFIAV